MTALGSVSVSTVVDIDRDAAFKVFTEEIDAWYRSTPYSWMNPARAVGIRLEPGPGGRLVELWDDGGECAWARVTVWEPGVRFVLDWGLHEDGYRTEVEVRFADAPGGTRVTIEHRGWDKLPLEVATRGQASVLKGWPEMLRWYRAYLARPDAPR